MPKLDIENDQEDTVIVGKNIILLSNVTTSFLNRPCFTGSLFLDFIKIRRRGIIFI